MYQTHTATQELSGRLTGAGYAPRVDSPSFDEVIARRGTVLSAVLQEPVLRRTFARIAEGYVPDVPSSAHTLAQRIDHTLLDPVAQPDDIAGLCQEAVQWHFATVCVNSRFVSLATDLLQNTGVGVCAAIAFPFGAMSTEAKVCEARSAAWDGASEVDMVLPIGLLKAKRYREVFADILYVRQAVERPVQLRVVLETGLLTTDEMVDSALIAVAAGADFVKTSTGFLAPGASLEDVQLLRGVLGGAIGIKVAGNIHTWGGALSFLAAGASRIGSCRGIEVMTGFLASRSAADKRIDTDRGLHKGVAEGQALERVW